MTTFWNRGDTVVVRDVMPDGEILRAIPFFAVSDTTDVTALFVPDGTEYMMASRLSGSSGPLPLCPRRMGPAVFYRDAIRLMFPDTAYAVYVHWDLSPRRFRNWYVNLEAPYRRTTIGFDTFDHELDIVVNPDLTWRWKDEDDLAAMVKAGAFDPAYAEAIWESGRQAARAVERRGRPFCDPWPEWTPPAEWGAPRLPDNWAAGGLTLA